MGPRNCCHLLLILAPPALKFVPENRFLPEKRPQFAARIPASPLIVRIIRGPRNGDRILGTKLGSQNSHFCAPNLLRGWSF